MPERAASPSIPPTPQATTTPSSITLPNLHCELTHAPLSPTAILDHIRSPAAGALVLFAGTTRATFDSRAVSHLSYSAYIPLALRTLQTIASIILTKHSLISIAIVHRLGDVPIGEESILIAVSSPHRAEAWRAGEEALEEVKRQAEIWKLETFVDGGEVWRANRDGEKGVRVGCCGGGGEM
ncbi:Molybdopterin synthase catalytic subunit [Rhizina undulata]